jgi:WD40 repeat protein
VSQDGRFALRVQLLDEDEETFQLIWFDFEEGVSKVLSSYGSDFCIPALDPSGSLAICAGIDGVIKAGPVTGEEPHLFFAHEGAVRSVVVSPDGRWIASAGFDGKIRLWPIPDTNEPPLHTLPYEELLIRLRTVTNVRVVEDEASSTGYRVGHAPFPGWETVPEW